MYNVAQDIIDCVSRNVPSQGRFVVATRQIENPYPFQFYVDYGVSDMGPWAAVGFDRVELVIGYPPAQRSTINIPSPSLLA